MVLILQVSIFKTRNAENLCSLVLTPNFQPLRLKMQEIWEGIKIKENTAEAMEEDDEDEDVDWEEG